MTAILDLQAQPHNSMPHLFSFLGDVILPVQLIVQVQSEIFNCYSLENFYVI